MSFVNDKSKCVSGSDDRTFKFIFLYSNFKCWWSVFEDIWLKNEKNTYFITLADDRYLNTDQFSKVCFGPEDRYIMAGSFGGTVVVWNIDEGVKKDVLKTDSNGVTIVCEYNGVSGNLFTGDSRGTLTIWH